jgi:hypothetical protein
VLAVGLVDIGDARRFRASSEPVAGGVGPELPGLGLASATIEHRRPRLVGEQLVRALQDPEQPIATGRSAKAARPNQSASVEHSSSTPWRP